MRKIILATASPQRVEIFRKAGLPFESEESGFEETTPKELSPHDLVEHFAVEKARAVAKRYPEALVIGADTVVVLGSEIFGKPKTRELACAMLKKLSGTTHSILTGFAIVGNGKEISRVEETKITFRKLSDEEITAYVESGEALEKAGGYALQLGAAKFIDNIEGDRDNGIGLPLSAVLEELRKFEPSF